MVFLRGIESLFKRISPFFFSLITTENTRVGCSKIFKTLLSGIFTKPTGFHSVFGKKSVTYNHRIILLLITLLMVSGILIPGVSAAGPLTVDFNAVPQFGVRPLGVQFNDTTTSADPANNTYLWRFGDGITSTLKNPRHTYTSSGIFTVNLTVRELSGNKATISKPFYIHVADTANATDFSGTPQCGFSPLPVQFIDGTTIAHDTWQWDFGDGGASNVSDPLYTYTGDGAWNVSLYISNTSGGPQSLISKSGYIQVIPVAVPSFSAAGTRDSTTLTVQFTDTSTGFVSPVTWFWDFGDGTNAVEQNPSHTYADPSLSYLVSFTVTGYCGQTITQLGYISASGGSLVFQPTSVPLAPVADFSGAPLSGSAPLDVAFEDLSTDAPTSWSWLFGDGNSSTLRNPAHTYANPGNYTVSLTAFNSIGSSSKTRTEYIKVSGYLLAPPQGPVDFTATPTYGSTPLTVQFTAYSTGFTQPETYLWNFGDGSTSTVRNASHSYSTAGIHTVSLTITGSDGYSVTMAKPGYINTELPSIELILSEEPLDPSLLANEIIPQTQSTPVAKSLPLAESRFQSQSLPMAKSVPPGISGYNDQSLPQDISPQNELSAFDFVFTWPRSGTWRLHLGENSVNPFKMYVVSSENWKVTIRDAMDVSKPHDKAGKMREYDFSSSSYVSPNGFLTDRLSVTSLSGYTVILSDTPGLLQTGDPWFKGSLINLNQKIETSDHASSPQRGYRIVIVFEASPNV
jgi:PKD repeat protein